MTARRPLVRHPNGYAEELPTGDTILGAPGGATPVTSMSVAYTNGVVTGVTEDGVAHTITYNTDGTVHTVSYPRGSLTRTETYSYTSGKVSGMTATEA